MQKPASETFHWRTACLPWEQNLLQSVEVKRQNRLLKSKKMVSHLARVLCSSAFPGVRISSESHMALPVGEGHGGGPCPSEEQTGSWSSEGTHVFFLS